MTEAQVHFVDCGMAVVKIMVLPDHVHLTVLSESDYDDGAHQPAESAHCYFGYDDAQLIIKALQSLKPALKVVPSGKH